MLFELINPSDPYTFIAPSLEVAGVTACLLSSGFGARCLDVGHQDEVTPILFGWDDWLEDRGIDSEWMNAHKPELAEALESFLIGSANHRADVEAMLAMIPDDKKEQWKNERQDRHRTSMNRIGEAAYSLAKKIRDGKVSWETK